MGFRAVGAILPPPFMTFCELMLTGKSTTTIQFVENHFVETYNPTIEDVFHKTVRFKGIDYVTEIVDTSGQVLLSFDQLTVAHLVSRTNLLLFPSTIL